MAVDQILIPGYGYGEDEVDGAGDVFHIPGYGYFQESVLPNSVNIASVALLQSKLTSINITQSKLTNITLVK